MERERILLCLAHISGSEIKFVKEAFDTNWGAPLGPNVNGFDKDLEAIGYNYRIKGQEKACKQVVTGAVGGASGVTHVASNAVTDCHPNDNVEALRMTLDAANIEARPLREPMHRQPVYRNNPAYTKGVSEALFATGICLPRRTMGYRHPRPVHRRHNQIQYYIRHL